MSSRNSTPPEVREILRKEVGYGCPICRSPFLTWHHFDPPYHVRPHNDPEGMIALCREHHDEADNDNWPPERLQAMKKSVRSFEDVRGSFPSWEHEEILVRLGGNYTGGSEVLLSISEEPVLALRRNPVGLLALSFSLFDADGTPLLRMIDNALELYPETIHDFIATAKKREIKLWLPGKDVGLQLRFDRVTPEELSLVLQADFNRSNAKMQRRNAESGRLSSGEPRSEDFLEIDRNALPSWIDSLPAEFADIFREGFLTGDNTGAFVKQWATKRCTQSDGKIPFLDFECLSIYHRGKAIRVRDGIGFQGLEFTYCASFGNHAGAFSLLPVP